MVSRPLLASAVKLTYCHPSLIRWYLQGRVRMRGIRRDQLLTDGSCARPLGITLKPTFACNLRCAMCTFVANGAVRSNPRDSLPLEVWTGLIDDVASWKPYIWFTGGEPTVYPQIVPLIDHIKRRGLFCGMTSNGTTLARHAEDLVRAGLDLLVVSIDGRGETHNRVRGNPRAFDRACAGVQAVKRAGRLLRRRNPAVVINCSLTPDNYTKTADMMEVAAELGAAGLNYQHLWMMTRGMVAEHNAHWGDEHYVDPQVWAGDDQSGMDPERVWEVVSAIKRSSSKVPVLFHPDLSQEEIAVYYSRPEQFVRRGHAVCAWANTDVLPNGDVSPCFDMVCGNITDASFTEIWNNETFRRHRQRLGVNGDFPICARCCAYWRRD